VARRNRTAHLGLYDTLPDWEVGHLLAELRSGRFTGVRFAVVSVGESLEPITTMGGVRMLPDALIGDLKRADSDLITAGPQSPSSSRAPRCGASALRRCPSSRPTSSCPVAGTRARSRFSPAQSAAG
jgi:hypothetical protein